MVKSSQPVNGECTDIDYPESIEILSFRVGSMSGFTDTDDAFNAAKKVGGENDTPNPSKKKLDSSEGTDLAGEEACNFQITKEMDLSSPDLFRAYCSSQDPEKRDVFDSGTVTLRKATGKARAAFLTYTFNDVIVTSYSLDIGGDASPKETVVFSFARVRVEFRPQKATGGMGLVIKGGWDFIARTAW